jgi:hypothetical protein
MDYQQSQIINALTTASAVPLHALLETMDASVKVLEENAYTVKEMYVGELADFVSE